MSAPKHLAGTEAKDVPTASDETFLGWLDIIIEAEDFEHTPEGKKYWETDAT